MSIPPKGPCQRCAILEIHLFVAIRTSYYVALHVVSIPLRELVLDDVASEYIQYVSQPNTSQPDFEEFFRRYRENVERALDPGVVRAGEQILEYRRVWTDHATNLRELQFQLRQRQQSTAGARAHTGWGRAPLQTRSTAFK
jgi:hypothetical protein